MYLHSPIRLHGVVLNQAQGELYLYLYGSAYYGILTYALNNGSKCSACLYVVLDLVRLIKMYERVVRKHERKRLPGKLKIILKCMRKVTGNEGLDWINLAQDGVQWCILVNVVMDLRVLYKVEISRVAE